MIFPNKNKKRKAVAIMIVALALVAYIIVRGYIGTSDHPNGTTVTATQTTAATVPTATNKAAGTTKVAQQASRDILSMKCDVSAFANQCS